MMQIQPIARLPFKVVDAFRIAHNEYQDKQGMVKNGYEFRYEQTGDSYRLQGFFGAPDVNRTAHGTLATRPPWLVKIIDVAVVAGAVRTVDNPPPDMILWFHTDKDFNLTEYVDV